MSEAWQSDFKRVWDVGMAAWTLGRRSAGEMFGRGETPFLGSIGCTPQELFDFIDDCNRYGEPDRELSLEVAAVRRDYFLEAMEGRWSGRRASMADLPAKTDAVDGIPWLPRLIAKARLKLRGEMPDDLMYGCGGDRAFIARTRLTLPGFLRLVWECGDDDRRIVEAVKASLRPD